MNILGDILGTSALTGGVFGLAGNIASKVLSYFETEQSFSQQQAQWDHDLALRKLQQPIAVAAAELPDTTPALNASVQADGAIPPSYEWVNAVRALVRPVLTLGLAIFLAVASFAMPEADRAYVVDSLVFAAVTAIVWWFGDRAPRRALH